MLLLLPSLPGRRWQNCESDYAIAQTGQPPCMFVPPFLAVKEKVNLIRT